MTTGSTKNGTLRRINGFVSGFGERSIDGTGYAFMTVTVTAPDGEKITEAPSRLALISR